MSAHSVGIDLSTTPRNTAAVILEWERSAVSTELRNHLGPTDLADVLQSENERGATVAIDVPFGWPIGYVNALAGYHDQPPRAWPAADHGRATDILRRRTDEAVREHLGQVGIRKSPISVAVDKLASTAAYWAALAGDATPERKGYARDGSDGVIEVYPVASLAMWGMWQTNAKALDVAGSLFAALDEAGIDVGDQLRTAALGQLEKRNSAGDGHVFDALVAALTARSYQLGLTVPIPDDDADDAAVEGWIHLPDPDVGFEALLP